MADVFDAFYKTADDKRDIFEETVLKRVLKDIGVSNPVIDLIRNRLGEEFKFEALNNQDVLPFKIHATRIFSYNLGDILFNPDKHPIVKEWRKLPLKDPDEHTVMVIRYDRFQMVISNFLAQAVRPYIFVPLQTGPLYISMLRGFFTQYFLQDADNVLRPDD